MIVLSVSRCAPSQFKLFLSFFFSFLHTVFIIIIIFPAFYLFVLNVLTVLGLRCYVWAFSGCSESGLLSSHGDLAQ